MKYEYCLLPANDMDSATLIKINKLARKGWRVIPINASPLLLERRKKILGIF